MDVRFIDKTFDALSADELYDVLKLRTDVFVVEQACAYAELDGKDKAAIHLLGKYQEEIVCYARIFAPTPQDEQYAKIGRVLVHPSYRGQKLAHVLMKTAIDYCMTHYHKDIFISAQVYLSEFYQSLGFEKMSEPYLEDGIAHIDMIRSQSFT